MIDTIPILIDTTGRIINIIIPEKSFIEEWTPLIGLVLTIITIIVGSYWNIKQIKNSHVVLERTIDANWKSKIKESKFNIDLKILEEFKILRLKMIDKMEIMRKAFKDEDKDKKDFGFLELMNQHYELYSRMKLEYSAETVRPINTALINFQYAFFHFSPVEDKSATQSMVVNIHVQITRYTGESLKFLEEETERVLTRNN